MLLETGNYTSIIDLCLRKARAIQALDPKKGNHDVDELKNMLGECYEVVLSLFGALDDSIEKKKVYTTHN
jgi:hypothetical protein